MTTAQVVETSVTVNNNSPIQNYVHPDDQTQPTFVLYFLSRFVSLVFIRLIILRVQIKKYHAYSQLSKLQQTVKYFTRPLLVLFGLTLLAFK